METETIRIAIAAHAMIYNGPKPPHITTQSNRLWLALAMPRARVYLQRCKARYGDSWGYSEPRLMMP